MQLRRPWEVETVQSLAARVEAARVCQQRTRWTLAVLGIISLTMMAASYNAYLSFDYEWALNEARHWKPEEKNNVRDILVEQGLRTWGDSRTVDLSLLGLRVSVDDAVVIGPVAMLFVSTWLFVSCRRENHVIGQLLLHVFRASESTLGAEETLRINQRKWLVFQSVTSNSLLTNFNYSFEPISSLQGDDPASSSSSHACHCIGRWILQGVDIVFFALPLFACIFTFVLDRTGYVRESPYQPLQVPPGDSLYSSFYPTSVIGLTCMIALGAMCWQSLQYALATGRLLEECHQELRTSIDFDMKAVSAS